MMERQNFKNPRMTTTNQLEELKSNKYAWAFGVPTAILISGKAGVGKTTSANILHSLFEQTKDVSLVKVDSFASSVKRVATIDYGWDGKKDTRGRKLLQDVGRIGREYNKNIWIEKVFEDDPFPASPVIIDDWRFPNEYIYTKDLLGVENVYSIRVYAPNRETLKDTPAYEDVSETSITEYDMFDFVINNEGSMQELRKRVIEIYDDIMKDRTRI